MKQILLLSALGVFGFLSANLYGAEYFVRLDGGTLEQCSGLVNKPYTDQVDNQACAVKHLYELLDPQQANAHINGGDIITILNNSDGTPAEYVMGSHAEYISGKCSPLWAYDCILPPIPGGTAEQPTIIRGHMEGQVCGQKPILQGINRARRLMSIENASHIKISCLTLTDKSSCINASGFPDQNVVCDRSKPYDKPFADVGLYMIDASNIKLTDLRIEGLSKGIHAGRLSDIFLTRVDLFANSGVGWDGDVGANESANSGVISFVDSSITFSGCGLYYDPESEKHRTPHSCAKQSLGGYGDGLGTHDTGGDWIFDNVKIMHNNSDGIDLLYKTLGGKVVIKNSRIEGNGGNQIKVSGDSELTNNLVVSNCYWNDRQSDELGGNGENCRALGSALSLSYTHTDTKMVLLNNTIFSEGDCLLTTGNRTNTPVANQSLAVVNNVFYGLPDRRSIKSTTLEDDENTCLYYTKNPIPNRQIHNNVIHKPKEYGHPCTQFNQNIPEGGNEGVCTATSTPYFDNQDQFIISNPHFSSIGLGVQYTSYDLSILEKEANHPVAMDNASPLVDAGYEGVVYGVQVPERDYYGYIRNGQADIGAIEFFEEIAQPKAPTIIKIEVVEQ